MFSFKGTAAAAAAIILAVGGLGGFIWMLDDQDMINYINGWVLLGGFTLLLLGALVYTYRSASAKVPAAPHAAGAKAIGMQLCRIILILAGMLGLVIVIGVITH